jgi:phosphatidylserine/phosphatidylglycerophosphate/cardiolipin synthase-like enzyme
LDHADLPDAAEVWIEMIDSAQERLDFLEFYGSTEPESALERVLEAVGRAVDRGVRVRFVFDRSFHELMPEIPDRLARVDGVEVRIYDVGARTGGVQHAKLFVVDDREVYVGSQNFDWRSLEHIQELGVRVSDPALVGSVRSLFELDWALAGGVPFESARRRAPTPDAFPVTARFRGAEIRVTPVFSPRGLLPAGAEWDWPHLERLLDGAARRVRLQMLGYHVSDPEGEEWRGLDDALRRAARRGVRVEILLSDWSRRTPDIDDLKALARLDHVEVRLVTIPPASRGFIPYARTIHAKYLTVDGRAAWLGTSNGSGDYFLNSRNAGFVVDGAPFADRLDDVFSRLWDGPYAERVDPDREYEPPRIE